MEKNSFLHLGDHPILDFCNTVICHGEDIEDRLNGPKDAESFVNEFFSIKSKVDSKTFGSLIELRSLLRRYFYFILGLQETDPAIELNSWFAEHPLILSISNSHVPEFTAKNSPIFFANMISSLNSFLSNLDEKRLKKCANPNCSHLFYDISKNNKRQWCSMNSCGNIMKARAFYARRKGVNKK
jgi:predicted RNA-binding Zn ribbon-like protein